MEVFVHTCSHLLNKKAEDGHTLLHTCASYNHLDSLTCLLENVKMLVSNTFNICLCKDRCCELNIATSCSLQEACDANAVTEKKKSALHLAVQHDHMSIVERLVGYGCLMNIKDEDGDTPLHLAVRVSFTSGLSDQTPQMNKVTAAPLLLNINLHWNYKYLLCEYVYISYI